MRTGQDTAPTMNCVRHILDNGLKLIIIELPHLHAIELGVFVKSGPRYETRENNGISHFVEHTLFRGTRSIRNTFELHAEMERLGTPISASTSRDFCQYAFQVPPRNLERAAELFAEIMLEPAFEDIELERRIVLEEFLIDLNEHGEDISLENHSRALMWGDHPLGMNILGTEQNIREFGREDLAAHHERFYTARNSVLYLAGPVSSEQALALARRWFGRMPAGEAISPLPVVSRFRGPRYRLVDHDASQVQLSFSFSAPAYTAQDHPTMLVLERLLTDGMAARIPWTICERLGMSYDIDGGLESYWDTSVFDIDASIGRGKVVALARELLAILEDVRSHPVRADELDRVKQRWHFSRALALDNPGALASWVAATELYQPAPDMDEAAARIDRVTPTHVQAVAQEIFTPRNLAMVVVGRLSRLERQHLLELINGHSNGRGI